MRKRRAWRFWPMSRKMGLVFQHTGAATTKKFIREQPDIVRRYVRAHVEAVARMWTDKEADDQSPRHSWAAASTARL